MQNILLVFLGGGLGASLRYLVSELLRPYVTSFPWGTFVINLVGSFLLGLWIGYEMRIGGEGHRAFRLLFSVGFCGGFTTFSTFSLESFWLIHGGLWTTALLYALSSLVLGGLLVALGFFCSSHGLA